MWRTARTGRSLVRRGWIAPLVVLTLGVTAVPVAADPVALGSDATTEIFTELPINDTDNPCGSAVGSAVGLGIITTITRDDGSTRVVTRFLGEFEIALPGDPIPNVWDPEATAADGALFVKTVEDSRQGFRLRLRVWGETDTGVPARINQKLVAGPEGGHMRWNCFDGTGRHRIEF